MGKKAESEPSGFWARLSRAWRKKGLPTSQNGVATLLDMSQGSTRRWYTGEGYPETTVLRDIAKRGDVTIDWLLNDSLPQSPIGRNTSLGRFLAVWEQLDEAGKAHVHQAALGQLAIRPPTQPVSEKKPAAARRDDVSRTDR